jgi:hypothetical protein
VVEPLDRSVRVRTLRRAADIIGGQAPLRRYLNVSALCLAAWMSGADIAPTYVFLKAVDLVMEDMTRESAASRKPS